MCEQYHEQLILKEKDKRNEEKEQYGHTVQ